MPTTTTPSSVKLHSCGPESDSVGIWEITQRWAATSERDTRSPAWQCALNTDDPNRPKWLMAVVDPPSAAQGSQLSFLSETLKIFEQEETRQEFSKLMSNVFHRPQITAVSDSFSWYGTCEDFVAYIQQQKSRQKYPEPSVALGQRLAWFLSERLPTNEDSTGTRFTVKLVSYPSLVQLLTDPSFNMFQVGGTRPTSCQWDKLALSNSERSAVRGIDNLQVPDGVTVDLSGRFTGMPEAQTEDSLTPDEEEQDQSEQYGAHSIIPFYHDPDDPVDLLSNDAGWGPSS